MNRLQLVAAGAAALWLGGCASPGPAAIAAPEPPPQWHAPLPHEGTLAALASWWQQFNDPLLVELIESAQGASPTIASAASRIEQARAARIAATAALLPTLDAVASVTRNNTQPPLPLATAAQAGLQANWEIDLFGGNRAAADATQERLAAARAFWHEARVSVAAETATSYVGLRICQQLLAVAENDARSRAETARLAELSAQAGFTAPATAALARASAAEGAVRTTQQRAQCDVEVKALVALTSMPEPQLRQRLAVPWSGAAQPTALAVAAVPAQLLAQRPDVYRAEREVAAASADVGAAQAQRFPRLSLAGSIAAGSVRTGGATTDLQTWSIGPLVVALPLFDGGRRAANVEAAQARYQEAANHYAARVRQAVREVEEALVSLESARLRTDDARVAMEDYRTWFAATEARYRGGLGSLVELEDARRTALVAEILWVTLQRERVNAWVALYRAMGGGWTRPGMPAHAVMG